MKLIDITGKRYGRLIVDAQAERNRHSHTMWKCRCDCGNTVIVSGQSLKSGNTLSCGCLRKEKMHQEKLKHGHSGTRLYKIWKDINKRCANPRHNRYARYGGRGIAVCEEWKNDFAAFHAWAISSGYEDGLTIERKDNDGNYCPENCCWATREAQANNKSTSHKITYKGETKTIAEWSRVVGINQRTLYDRINVSKWDAEKALTTPPRGRGWS